MRNIIVLIACSLLFTQCRPDKTVEVYPTGTFDTLGITWMSMERDHIIYYFQGTGVTAASIYSDMHERAYEQLYPVFNPELPGKLRYYVWTDWQQAAQLFQLESWVAGFALDEECACHVRADIQLGHEMTHIFTYWSGGIPPSSYARFINEGVAVAFDLGGDDKLATAKKAIKKNSFNGVLDLWLHGKDAPEDIIYPVSGAFMDFLYKQNMHDQFFALLKHQTYEDAESIYGQEKLQSLIADFDKQLGQ